ncbi:Glutamine transport ATP-binding protein GlnQ [Actinomyces bovis]|uniref:Glutamine transport ATP-binding protein GlnQ n=1 Tax=Actinomyces bovis TaxID=1658 RepID=A0ABY1VP60_9ACTO|nr:ATP-binding cassette domain-containing protein [Actinomyces bovis]SPT53765.1 Glutamine transport ATP-binding protein GlnQ [Actinomyces bovis]VEG53102.1 Glutamine transport ATP-binding protein GlnQ [Actinomyces israelii]
MPSSALAVRLLSSPGAMAPTTFRNAFTVGRLDQCDVVVQAPIVSRRHLEVSPTAEGWRVNCLSSNGMLVDGQRAQSTLITQGTRIQLGDASGPVLVLTPVGYEASGASAPSAPSAATTYGTAGVAPQQPAQTGYPQAGAPSPTPQASAPQSPAAPQQAAQTGYPQAAYTQGQSTGPARSGPVSAAPVAASTAQGGTRRTTLQAFRITSSGTIGRAADNTLVLKDDPLVSAHHARIDLTQQGIVVTDLGSTNGVWVGNQRMRSVLVDRPLVMAMGATLIAINPDGVCQVQTAIEGEEGLVAKDLVFTVDHGKRLLDQISFSLPGGELLAVVGPSGAGKSTLLKALTGEQKAQSGQVLFNGFDVYEQYAVMRNSIGVVPQNDVVHSALTVRQTLHYAAELRLAADLTKAERAQRIREVLEDLDLTEHVDKRVKKLSGGQRKRVSTAIELLTKPKLLFLDEPTSGLDPQLDRDVMDLLATLAHGTRPGDTGRTVMVVTHNENHIDRADKVLILAAGGKPVYFGSPREVIPYFRARHAELARAGQLLLHAPKGGFADPGVIDGYADVYALIRNHTEPLRGHLEQAVPSTRRGATQAQSASRPAPTSAPRKQAALRQISTLVRRHLRIIAADPSYLAFMLVLPLVMGLLTKAIKGDSGFGIPVYAAPTPDNPCPRISTQALELLVIMITGGAFAGMSVTIRELIGERDVFLREKAVGLRSGAYMFGKALVLALIVTVQTALMAGTALALNDAPDAAILLGSPGLELAVACWAVAFVSGLLGLAISSFVSSSEQVMPVLVVSIMGQLVLSGGLIPVAGRAVFEQLSWLMPARWGYAMAGATVELNKIVPHRHDALWEHSSGQWLWDLGMLALVGCASLCLCFVGLARRGQR